MSDWHDELEFALLPLEDAKIDSDCMTGVSISGLGDEDELPHGLFQPSNYPRVRYQGTSWLVSRLDTEDLRAMKNDAYSKVKLPWLAGQASAA